MDTLKKYSLLKKQYFLIENDGILQVSPMPKNDELIKWYENEYFTYDTSVKNQDLSISENSPSMISFKLINQAIKELSIRFKRPNKVLDLGCGDGFFSRLFIQCGIDTYSADFTEKTVRHCSPSLLGKNRFESGDILNTRFFSNQTFDFVLVKNVLEHVIEPQNCLDKIRDYLSPEGIACITVPNDYSIMHKQYLKGNNKVEAGFFIPPTHLNYFNTESIQSYLKKNNFTILDAFCDFPMEQFLLVDETNYYTHPEFGPVADKVRTNFMQTIVNQNVKNAIDLCRSYFNNGIGRNAYLFVQSNK